MRARKRTELNSPKYWRDRAECERASAEKAKDDKIRTLMLGFAEGYEKMAHRVEKLAKRSSESA